MAIYMQIEGINGNVSTTGHENAIELLSLMMGVQRNVRTITGVSANRSGAIPNISEIEITKSLDKSSILLFQQACGGKVIPTVSISYVQTSARPLTYKKIKLSNVLLSSYYESFDDINEQQLEVIRLNFSQIEQTFYPRGRDNLALPPVRGGYDREKAELL